MKDWDILDSRLTYSIAHWGDGYFDINDLGHLEAFPVRGPARESSNYPGIDLYELSQQFQEEGLSLPVLVRFTDILHDRVWSLNNAFQAAIEQDQYNGIYTPIYPIKVNQQRSVVEEILSCVGCDVGLEAGSKPELMAVLALSSTGANKKPSSVHEDVQPVIICNGYKDREYARLALIGQQLGYRVYIVVEKLSELDVVIRESHDLGITPRLGIRVRLTSMGAGKWQNSGGEKSKFGLSAQQVLQVIERLESADMLDSLQLLHFHMGSQISNIQDIQQGMKEAARYYQELREAGVDIKCIDVGGGLGVDYEGTRSRSFCSMNYSMDEYAKNIVHALYEICEENGYTHPDIMSESGRAMTAHHAVLVTNVINVESPPEFHHAVEPSEDAPSVLHELWNGLENLSSRSVLEAYHQAEHLITNARSMFVHGVLELQQCAHAEKLYLITCRKVQSLLQSGRRAHRELLDDLNEKLANKYFCNFSIFQSMPDVWAIQQLFPIVPLHRLDEQPTQRAVVQDITCDSDGRIALYVDNEGVESTLPVHALNENQEYLLGIFMVGAYQEILGDMHNLFGDTDSVNVEIQEDGSYHLSQAEQGDTVEDVLRYVHFDPDELLQTYRDKIADSDLSEQLRNNYLEELETGLRGYTYLEDWD